MSSAPGNVFLTYENLAFSLPLIGVCTVYAYFKFIPLQFGLPILGGAFLLYQAKTAVKAQQDKKLQNMDEKTMEDLALELEGEKKDDDAEAKAKALAKKKAAIELRLAAEARKEAKRSKSKKGKDDDDDIALDTFARGGTKKKN
eukprot:Nitzschia sp. Nitz4//scaffold76_size158648//151066//151722//NITZ4_002571-RA/size158648-processed-gene-0.220-mRNA-1//-1//CDS//3329557920//87//frame0